jgi:phage gpG-like protein
MGDALVRAQILVRGDVANIRRLEEWAMRASNSEPAMESISVYMEDAEKRLFDSEGASGGRPWTPDAENTTTRKNRNEFGFTSILRDSLALFKSLTESSDENAIREIGPGWLRFGTKLGYADLLKRGTNKMVARSPMRFSVQDRAAIAALMRGWITGRTVKGMRPSMRIFRGPWL